MYHTVQYYLVGELNSRFNQKEREKSKRNPQYHTGMEARNGYRLCNSNARTPIAWFGRGICKVMGKMRDAEKGRCPLCQKWFASHINLLKPSGNFTYHQV
jgi:hypothetical protein